MRPRSTAIAVPLLLILAACGAATDSPAGPAKAGEWSVQHLKAKTGADYAPMLATRGDDTVLVTLSEDEVLTSHVSRAGGPFEVGEPLGTEAGFVDGGDVVALPDGGWLVLASGGMEQVDGDDQLRYDPLAFRSDDGLTWEPVEVTGFPDPVSISEVTVVGDVLVVSGSTRLAKDPSMGGSQAHVWTSADGSSFTQIDLPGVPQPRGWRRDSYAGATALVGDRVIVTGRSGREAAVWTSDDAGETWQRVESPALAEQYAISGVAVAGETLVASVGEGTAILTSADAGETWRTADPVAEPASEDSVGYAPMWGDGSRAWTLTGIDDMSWSEPEVCYADLDQCGQAPEPSLVTSTDGSAWADVTLPGGTDGLDEIVGTDDGRVLAVTVVAGGLDVYTLLTGTEPPPADAAAEPQRVDLIEPPKSGPEAGVRYHAPMYVHCGMDWLYLGDTVWRRTDDGPDISFADEQPGWPMVGQTIYGYATQTDTDTVEYSIDGGEVIATYRRAADEPPGCA